MAADFCITGEVKLNSDPAEKATSKWTVAAGQLIADFAKKAASSLQSVVKSGLDYNAQMESYLTNFKVMLGDEQLAAEKLEEIRRMAASTPFSLSDLTEGTQTLLQFGIAADDTTGVLQRLGDISLGNADKLQTLVRAYGKMSSAQKVTLENVNMMIDAGFNPLNQICDATGESMSALYKRISDGKVSFNELEAAVAAATSEGGQFYNGMLEASQTFNGRLSTLTDNTKALLGALSDSFYSSLSDLLPVANDVVLALTDAFTEGGVPAMMDTAAELLDSFADGLIQKIPDGDRSGRPYHRGCDSDRCAYRQQPQSGSHGYKARRADPGSAGTQQLCSARACAGRADEGGKPPHQGFRSKRTRKRKDLTP